MIPFSCSASRKILTGRIVLMKSVAGIVTTSGMEKIGQFFNQRSRWASKSRHYTDRDILYTAGLVLGMSAVLIVCAVAMAFGRNMWLFPCLLMAKSLVDFLFLQDFLRFYAKRIQPGLFLLFETVYPVYILISAAMGLFNRYTWKDRKYAVVRNLVSELGNKFYAHQANFFFGIVFFSQFL